MRQVWIYRNSELAGKLSEENNIYVFRYADIWFADTSKPAISLTLPKSKQEYRSEYLFPFFFNMLAEGRNKKLQIRQLRIDEDDYFGLLMTTAQCDTVGAITVKQIESEE